MSVITMAKERPILFKGVMIEALLYGLKSQTRRIIPNPVLGDAGNLIGWRDRHGNLNAPLRCKHGSPGDVLWVKETAKLGSTGGVDGREWVAIEYRVNKQSSPKTRTIRRSDTGPYDVNRWTPSIHMTRWASRICREITDVRVQRLHEISWADALAEGISECLIPATGDHPDMVGYMVGRDDGVSVLEKTPQEAYRKLWESINGPGSWDANPHVWAISFRRLEPQP